MSPDTAATRLKREEIIHLVAQHLVTRGFENSGIRALAESVGISDRMLMYYFEKKEDLIAQALLLLAEGMTASLDELIPQNSPHSPTLIIVFILVSCLIRETS